QGENTSQIVVDQQNKVWVAKEHYGVCQWQGDSWRVFTAKDGIASVQLAGLLVLKDGSILASSAQGISRYDGHSWTPYAYPKWFSMSKRMSGMKSSSDGSIWLNYSSEESRDLHMQIDPQDRRCTIRHRPETNAPFTRITEYLERVSQPGNCHVEWTGYDLWGCTPTEELQYSWRLDDGEWSPFSLEIEAQLFNLSSGQHTFEVRARDRWFNVDPTPERIVFTVIPPVWKQGWFIGMMLLFVTGVVLFIWMFMFFHDKRLKDQQKHMLELHQFKTSFFLNISHELRTPLSVMLAPLESLLRAETDEIKKQKLSMVIRSASRVSTLITQLLDLRKLELGKMEILMEEGDVAQQVKEAVEMLQPLAQAHSISCRMEGVDVLHGWMDSDKLGKIVTNLVVNAIKYTPAGGEVLVIIDKGLDVAGRDMLVLMVEDTGLGIAPEHLKRIFEQFYRASEKSIADGSGIGLSLIKELVDLWGGEISVTSPIHDNVQCPGSRFVVKLRIDQEVAVKKG
ncbi:MAG: hypothetical protein FJ220_03560, partial [Kiritimatiellaceae bacterium]|nr:hypothetical protein [Kiritimatiellaceae bacterium]